MYSVFYSRKEAFFESLCNDKSCLLVPGLLRLKPAPNDGTPGSLSHLLDPCEKAVDYESISDGNLFKSDTCRYPSQPPECSKCVCPYCEVSRVLFLYPAFLNKNLPNGNGRQLDSRGLSNTRTNLYLCCIVLYLHYNTVQKHNHKERSKTVKNLTKPYINLSEYWTRM